MSWDLTIAVRAFVVTVISWLLLATLFAMPVLAEDEDEDEGPPTTSTTSTTTTTTTTVPTTTTTTPTPTTSSPPPTTSTTLATTTTTIAETKTTTSTVAPHPTTTTLPASTTTTEPLDQDSALGVLSPDDAGPTNPTPGPSPDSADTSNPTSPSPLDGKSSAELTGKGGFVISFDSARNSDAYAVDSGSNGRAHIDPREELSVAFRAVAETLESQILQAVILGVIVAILTLIGVDRVWDRRLAPPHIPVEKPVP